MTITAPAILLHISRPSATEVLLTGELNVADCCHTLLVAAIRAGQQSTDDNCAAANAALRRLMDAVMPPARGCHSASPVLAPRT